MWLPGRVVPAAAAVSRMFHHRLCEFQGSGLVRGRPRYGGRLSVGRKVSVWGRRGVAEEWVGGLVGGGKPVVKLVPKGEMLSMGILCPHIGR